jgi:hypothetical protein
MQDVHHRNITDAQDSTFEQIKAYRFHSAVRDAGQIDVQNSERQNYPNNNSRDSNSRKLMASSMTELGIRSVLTESAIAACHCFNADVNVSPDLGLTGPPLRNVVRCLAVSPLSLFRPVYLC